MAKYRIAWMPGDGVGNDVMEATRIVLDRMNFDAEYVPCDIGWEFWCKEGNALPDRTVKVLKETICGLFGAITSKPQSEAKEELAPELKDKGLVYFSPIVGLRQMFNLHTNMRPCKSYPGNPLNYPWQQDHESERRRCADRSSRVSRKHRRAVRRRRIFSIAGSGLHRVVRESENEEVEGQGGPGKHRAVHPHHEQARLHQHLQTSIRARQENRPQARDVDRKAECAARNRRLNDALLQGCRQKLSRYPRRRREHRRDLHVDVQESQDYSVLVAENCSATSSAILCAGLVGGLGFAPSANLGDNYAVFEPTHGSAPKYAGDTR